MAAEMEPTRGFRDLPCIRCGGMDQLNVLLSNVRVFACDACNESFTADEAAEALTRWTAVVAWVRTAPVVGE